MSRMPRDVTYKNLCSVLSKYGYAITRQTGSYIRLSSNFMGHEHSITIPAHSPIKIGNLNNILKCIAKYLELPKENLIESLFYEK
jgi:predicted RNA binding protein YcfA (HicA-like mRNA interferase family)